MGQANTKFLQNPTLEVFAFIERDKKKYNGLKLVRKENVTYGCYIVLVTDMMKNPFEEGISEEDRNVRLMIIEMRGITFHNITGVCLRRLFHKFGNLGETNGLQIGDIDWTDVVLLEKLDGSLIGPYILDGKIIWATKKGTMPEMEEYLTVSGFREKYERLVWSHPEWSWMFEWCSPNNKIIIPYTEQKLTLISARHIASGDYMPYEKLVGFAKEFGLPVVKEYKTKIDNVETFLKQLYAEKDIEGCVVVSKSTGTPLCKVKCTWYSEISRNVNYLQKNPAVRWEMTINDTLDDLMPHLVSPAKEEVIDFRNAVVRGLLERAEAIKAEVLHIVESLNGLEEKELKRQFHERVQRYGKMTQLYHAMRNDPEAEPYEIIIAFCKRNIGNLKFLQELSGVKTD